MAPALSTTGRLRSRTSDISDLLRGRHDGKTSTDSQAPPPIPTLLAESSSTPSKPKSKFSFLGRIRKSSAVSPASARAANDAATARQQHTAAADAAATTATATHSPSDSSVLGVDASQGLPPGPDLTPASQKPSASSSTPSPSNQRIPSGIPTATLRNLRTQNSTSFEHTRLSNDSQGTRGRKQSSSSSASRPIITISPPQKNLQNSSTAHSADAFHAPRSAPRPPGGSSGQGSQSSSRQSSQSGIPTPTATSSTLSERTALDSPAGTDTPSPATSVHSTTQFPIPAVDGPLATTSYKEESLLRKDHFEIGAPSETIQTPRRVTVSGSSQLSGKQGTSSVGRNFAQDRQQRRQISVLHYGSARGKQDASAGAIPGPSRVRRSGGAYSDSTSGNESTTSSHGTLSLMSRRRSAVLSSPPSGGVAASGGKKAPPPLMRTWHTPPSTGPPPTDPLPAPPTNAALQPLILSTPSRGNIAPRPSSPVGSNKSLPPVPAKDREGSVRSQGAKTPDLLSTAPSSPIRSEPEASAAGSSSAATHLSTSSPLPSPTSPTRPSLASPTASASSTPASTTPTRTPVREDAVKKLIADENATTDQLREALRTQNAKYARLMSYLLSLTERHGMEKHEFLRRIETLEQDARRRERELKGLRWLVANSSQSLGEKLAAASARNGSPQDPEQQGAKGKGRLLQDELTRADSGTLPRGEVRTRMRSCSESVASPSLAASISSFTRPILGPGSGDSAGRASVESPTGSTEEGLFELQTTIAEFIAPTAPSPPTSVEESQQQRQKGQVSTSSSTSSTASSRAVVGGRQDSQSPTAQLRRSNTLPDTPEHLPVLSLKQKQKHKQARRTSSPVLPLSSSSSPSPSPPTKMASSATAGRAGSIGKAKAGLGIGIDLSTSSSVSSRMSPGSRAADRDPHARSDSSTLSSIPSLTTLHTSSSGLSSIPETPRTDAFPSPPLRSGNSSDTSPSTTAAARRKKLEEERSARAFRRQSTSSLTSSTSSGSGSYATSSRVSASPSIGQVLDRSSRQPEMDAILRKLRAFGNHGSP